MEEEEIQTEELSGEERIRRKTEEKESISKTKKEKTRIKAKKSEPIKYNKIGRTEILKPPIFQIDIDTELKIPSIKKYPQIEYRNKIKPMIIEEESYSSMLIIPNLAEESAINYPSVISPRRILKTVSTRITIPKVILEEIPLQKRVSLQERALEETVERAKITDVSKSSGSEIEIESEEIPNFLDLLFIGGEEIESGEPVMICLEETDKNSFFGALETICKRIYREKRGGKPKAVIFSDVEELKREIRWIEAEDKIFSARLSKEEWDKLKKQDRDRIFNRIEQLFSQNFGFIIFNGIFYSFPERHRVNIIMLKPRELDTKLARKISEMVWGSVKTEESGTFDYIFDSARKNFEETLKAISKERGGIYVDATKPNEGDESEEHLLMKQFLVRYLTQKLIEDGKLPPKPDLLQIKEKIKTEKDTKEELGGDISADIKVEDTVYEVETLFSEDREGKIARNKITHTIGKYEEITSVQKINLVLDNLTFLRHLKDLKEIKDNYKSWQKKHGKNIGSICLI